jgi:hypothetical protein
MSQESFHGWAARRHCWLLLIVDPKGHAEAALCKRHADGDWVFRLQENRVV